MSDLEIEYRPTIDLKPYAENARTHSEAQIAQIAASITAFGWTNPVLVDDTGGLIAGHGRVRAASLLGRETVPTITLRGLTEQQKQALVIADNQLALNSGWDERLLVQHLTDLGEGGFDLSLIGFSNVELDELFDRAKGVEGSLYTRKVVTPVYEPKGDRPDIESLVDTTKAAELIAKIEASGASKDEKSFLIRAANRHAVFEYHAIAEYYCHASEEVQRLMEDSALVIIDFDKAIEDGYVTLSKRLDEAYSKSYGDAEDSEDDAA